MEHTKGKVKVGTSMDSTDILVLSGEHQDAIANTGVVFFHDIDLREREANAKRIVKCWNSHDDLLEACKLTCKECQNECGPAPLPACKMCKTGKAITQAEEE